MRPNFESGGKILPRDDERRDAKEGEIGPDRGSISFLSVPEMLDPVGMSETRVTRSLVFVS